jgi:hypothetical protein
LKFIDISQDVLSCITYPGDPVPESDTVKSFEKGDNHRFSLFSMSAHNGTHVDAPSHFVKDGKTIDEIPLEVFAGECFVARHEGDVTAEDAENILEKAEVLGADAITGFLEKHDMDVVLVIFDGKSFEISKELQKKIDRYLDEHFASDEKSKSRFLESARRARQKNDVRFLELAMGAPEEVKASAPGEKIDDIIDNIDESFSSMLFRIIDSKDLTDTQVYKRANIDRKLFSKIRSIEGYTPGKRTAIALAVALELNLDETDAFLKHAGYALSHAVKFDVIIEYFIVNGRYDIFEINEVLFKYDQPLLGA